LELGLDRKIWRFDELDHEVELLRVVSLAAAGAGSWIAGKDHERWSWILEPGWIAIGRWVNPAGTLRRRASGGRRTAEMEARRFDLDFRI
jgi:hypothetical protein